MKDYLLILDHAGAGNNQWEIIAAGRDISYSNFSQENLALFLHPCPGVGLDPPSRLGLGAPPVGKGFLQLRHGVRT